LREGFFQGKFFSVSGNLRSASNSRRAEIFAFNKREIGQPALDAVRNRAEFCRVNAGDFRVMSEAMPPPPPPPPPPHHAPDGETNASRLSKVLVAVVLKKIKTDTGVNPACRVHARMLIEKQASVRRRRWRSSRDSLPTSNSRAVNLNELQFA